MPGWTHPYWHDDIGATFGALMQDCDAILLYPLILGSGKRLPPVGTHATWKLIAAKPSPSGVVDLHYARA